MMSCKREYILTKDKIDLTHFKTMTHSQYHIGLKFFMNLAKASMKKFRNTS